MEKQHSDENMNTSRFINEIPDLSKNKETCCGCSACYATCPTQAILMIEDSEGFLYPSIQPEKCIRCYKCLSICIFKYDQKIKKF